MRKIVGPQQAASFAVAKATETVAGMMMEVIIRAILVTTPEIRAMDQVIQEMTGTMITTLLLLHRMTTLLAMMPAMVMVIPMLMTIKLSIARQVPLWEPTVLM
jgi:hypothetical protein